MHNRLSGIELSVLRGLADGLQSKEIATRLGRSRATIEFHIRVLYGKLDARSRAQLVARAFQARLFETHAEELTG